MGFRDGNKLEIAILTLAVVMITGLGYLAKSPIKAAALAAADIIYEMPRPKSFFAALFSLDDREVSRKYINPFDKKKKDAKKKDTKTAKKEAPKPAVKVVAKNVDQKTEVDKKPKVTANIVGGKITANGIGGDIGNGGNGGGGGNNVANAPAPTSNNSADNTDDTDKSKLAADQWISLVLAQPTQANVSKLVAAYMTKEVDDATFYTIVNDLLKNNKSDTQKMGLYAVSSIYSVKSFSVVSEDYEQLSSDVQSSAQSYLQGYASSGHLGVLMSALQTSDATTVEMATTVVIKGYQQAKAGVAGTVDPRNSRGDVNTTSVSGYSKFVSIFQQLAQSKDASIASLANSALSQIQSGVASL